MNFLSLSALLSTLLTSAVVVATTTITEPDQALPNVTLTKLTFGSCHKQKYEHAQIWQRIQEQDAQVWLWLGDAIYPPMRAIAPVSVLQQNYQALRDSAGYAALRQSTPHVFGTWDDHDFGGNDMGLHMPDKSARRKAFFDFLGYDDDLSSASANDDSAGRRQGVYHSRWVSHLTKSN